MGGDDFNQCLAQYIHKEFQKREGIDLSHDMVAMQRIEEAAEKAKIELSTMTSATISLPFITTTAQGPKNIDMTISRSQFNQLTQQLVERTILPMQNALNDARLLPAELDKIILVGGSSRIQLFKIRLKK